MLTVTDAYGHSVSLTLVGDYRFAHFAGFADVNGDTLITLEADDRAPIISDKTQAGSFTELAATTGSPTLNPLPPVSGTIHFTDKDLTDRPTASIPAALQSVTWKARMARPIFPRS